VTPEIVVRAAQRRDFPALGRLREALWPGDGAAEHAEELEAIFHQPGWSSMPYAAFVACSGDGVPIGFAEVGLRSHADGCDPSQPVGFVEGWYVEPEWRRRGVGAALLAAAEEWARAQGCAEMGSDALIDNEISQQAHEALGYAEIDRCVHYRKEL
jgi:aminoglycoside 6'-N-acetyltransferase I